VIGSLLAMRFYAKKPWIIAAEFWAVYLIIGILFGSTVTAIMPPALMMVGSILFGFIVFMALALYWLKMPTMISIIAFAVTYVIDYVIMLGFMPMYGGIL